MSAVDRPWWASSDGRLDPDVDPVEAHRDARRGDGEPPEDDGSWWVPATEAVSRLTRDLAAGTRRDGDGARRDRTGDVGTDERADGDAPQRGGGDGGGHRIDACGVCPICVGLRALGDARPDLVGHLAEAARQLALAVRAVVDAAADGGDPPDGSDGDHGTRRRAGGLQHIDLDPPDDGGPR